MTRALVLLAAGAAALNAATAPLVENRVGDVRLRGHVGRTLDRCLERQVIATDADYLAKVFRNHTEVVGGWRSEFWGKYMHSAAPFAKYTDSPKLMKSVRDSLAMVVSAQGADGYIGTYPEGQRSDKGWDIWGNKYTILGLLHGYELTGDKAVLTAAEKLTDYLIASVGPGGRPLHTTGAFAGLASGSVLEAVMALHRITGNAKYLDFAGHVVSELDHPDGARLLSKPDAPFKDRKAYEMMSCYCGLADYARVTGDEKMLATVVSVARRLATEEITLAGSGAACEHWCEGSANQHRPWARPQETCVTVTWMRLCQKMLAATADPFWADQIERSFYNAYLASIKADGSKFTSYTSMLGTRSEGQDHCYMETDCCNANGPRGFVAWLETFAMSGADDALYYNWYDTASVKATLSSGKKVELEAFSYYPSNDMPFPDNENVHIAYQSAETQEFTLMLRIPVWSTATRIVVNGKETLTDAKAGTYYPLKRTWKQGDSLIVNFDMSCKVHVVGDCGAFTVGPVLLARDSRFGDGCFVEGLTKKRFEKLDDRKSPFCSIVSVDKPGIWMEYALKLPIGDHFEHPGRNGGRVIRFCDFASAGGLWSQDNYFTPFLQLDYGARW